MLVNKFATSKICQHIKVNGERCAAPAKRGRKFCIFHESMHQKRPDYSVPMAEDAMSLQLAVMQIIRALLNKAIDTKTAALTLYGLQIASGNLNRFAQEHSTHAYDASCDKSLLQMFLDQLHLPQTPEEILAETGMSTETDQSSLAQGELGRLS